jgi:hypothetical protein
VSIRVMSLIWDAYPGGGGSELLALLALADWSDDEGRCWPAVAAIAEKARLSRSQAQRVVHGLIGSGFVLVEGNEYGGKPGATRQYRINLKAMTGRTDATGSVRATGSADAREGSHGCAERGRTHATQTISEPSVNHQGIADKPPVSSKAADPCPHQAIIDLYHEALPNNPKCKVLTAARKATIKARWNEAAKLTCKPFGYTTRDDGLNAWRAFFDICADSDFLTGKAPGTGGRPPFIAGIDFLMSASGFAKTLENHYHDRQAAA